MTDPAWVTIKNLRKATPFDAAKVEELLTDLAANGSLDARIQLELLSLNNGVANGDLKRCEAFAEGIGAIARAVQSNALPPDDDLVPVRWDDEIQTRVLGLAWAYLVGHVDHTDWGTAVHVLVADARVPPPEDWFRWEPLGGWELQQPTWMDSHLDATSGSGYLPFRSDDPDHDENGRRAHLIANAIAACRHGSLGNVPRLIWGATESSTTDNEVNKIGTDLGHGIAAGDITPGNIASWIKRHLCTEGRCQKGSVTPELIGQLRYGLLTGTTERHGSESWTWKRPLGTPPAGSTLRTSEEKMALTARVLLRPGAESAQFGRVVEGHWRLDKTNVENGTASPPYVERGPMTTISGELIVQGDDAGSYHFEASGVANGAAGNPSSGTYQFSAGDSICADGTLSGSDTRHRRPPPKSITRRKPMNFGELLHGATGPSYTERDVETSDSNWSYKFSLSAAPPPEHVDICRRSYDTTEIHAAVATFINDVTGQVGSVLQTLHMSGRTSEATRLTTQLTSVYQTSGTPTHTLDEIAIQIDDACQRMDDWWISNDSLDDLHYNDDFASVQEAVAKREPPIEQIIDALATWAESIADQIRNEDAVAAANIDDFSARLRREGLATFLR